MSAATNLTVKRREKKETIIYHRRERGRGMPDGIVTAAESFVCVGTAGEPFDVGRDKPRTTETGEGRNDHT